MTDLPLIPIPVLGVPCLNQYELLRRCIGSIDYPVEKLVLVFNGPFPLAQIDYVMYVATRNACVRQLHLVRHNNAGVAGSWNEIIKLFPAPWWMIANDDIQFASGDLRKMAIWGHGTDAAYGTNLTKPPPGMIYGNHGASWFAITRQAVETVGLFDENLYPAYLEDCDWSYRADVLGVRRADVPDVHALHGIGGHGSQTVNKSPELAAANARTHGGNFDYYRRKWGGLNGTETFATPFNDPHWPVWAWKFEPATRARQQWGKIANEPIANEPIANEPIANSQ